MKKFNRVLYAIISEMFESLLIDDPNMSNEELMQNLYQEFDETMQLVFDDLNSMTQISQIAEINIDGASYSKEKMIDMIVNGIDFTSQDLVSDSRSLMKHLSRNLDETFIVYPNYAGGPGNSTLLVERHNMIEAHISFEAGKVFLLKGDTEEPDIGMFKELYPEILKWVQGGDEQTGDDPPTNPEDKSKHNKIKKSNPNGDAIDKARSYMKNRFDYL